MKKNLSIVNISQIILSSICVLVILYDYFYSNDYNQESVFTILSTSILLLNGLRQAFTFWKPLSILSVVMIVGLMIFGLGITLVLMWGTAFQGAEIPIVFNAVLVLILALAVSLVVELRSYFKK
jgi:hypothetical protein